MGKAAKKQKKQYQLILNVPDQKHISYLSDAHSIYNSKKLAKGENIVNFENFLLECLFKTANEEVRLYMQYQDQKQQQMEKTVFILY